MSTDRPPGPLARRRRPLERPPGWRVEGGREPAPPGGGRKISWRRMAGVLLILLGLNWFVVSLLSEGDERRDVPYTVFREQVQAGNVAEVTSRGDTIQGDLPGAAPARRRRGGRRRDRVRDRAPGLRRRRAARAADRPEGGRQRRADRRGPLAAAHAAALVRAGDPDLRGALLPAAAGLRRGRRGAERPRPLQGQALRRQRPAGQLRGRGRHRGGRGGAGRDRRLPPQPGPLPAPGRPDPARRAALGAARDGQDAAGAGRGRRGRRAVLLALGLGVRRDHRGRRRQPGARPVRAGQGGRPGDHLHRRARRDRARARRRRSRWAATTSASRRSTRSSRRWTASRARRA